MAESEGSMCKKIQYILLIFVFLFIQCADSSPTGPTPDLDPVLLENTKIVFDSTWGTIPILFSRIANDVYTISPDGSHQLNISNTVQYVEWSPTWSSDGSRIIFVSVKIKPEVSKLSNHKAGGQLLSSSDENVGILSMAADGSDRKKINIGGSEPSWSPDGTRIAFTSNLAGHRNIYTINANGDGLKQLTNNYARDKFPRWSPDGSKIVFVSERDNNSEIYIMNSDGSNQINVTYHPDYDAFPDWSPDGSKIAFTSVRDGNAEIYLINVDGSNPVRITHHSSDESRPSWSPDGSKIAFTSNRDSRDRSTQIYIMNTDGTNQFKITNNSFFIRSLDWSPVIN